MAVSKTVSLVRAKAGNARRFSMIGCTNSTATCMASQELPPLPMTYSLCPAASASASLRQTSSNAPAFASKNFSFMEALSWHLRRTDSLNCCEEIGDKAGACVDILLGPQSPGGDHVASVVL